MPPPGCHSVQRLRDALGAANLAVAGALLVAIPPTAWMLAVWAILAAALGIILLGVVLFRRVLEIRTSPGQRIRLLRRAFSPVAAGLNFVVLTVQGADLEVHDTTQPGDYWLLAGAMVLAVFTVLVSYDRRRPPRPEPVD